MVDEQNPKRFPPPPPPGSSKPPALPGKPPGPPGLKAPALPSKGEAASPPGRPPGPPGKGPGLPGPQRPGPAAPGLSGHDLQERVKKMEVRSQELEDAKKKLERTVAEMDLKLKDEKEKALEQSIKAREEESLSLKMEQALKEMQEKSRIARREQELEDSRLRAEERVKDLERRLNEEREAWVINMKKQMELRDRETSQVESQIELRFKDLERRWVEEKSMLSNALRSKDEEIAQYRTSVMETQNQIRRAREESSHDSVLEKDKLVYELESKRDTWEREKRQLIDRLDMRERELVSLKAQLAMIDSQVHAAQDSSTRNIGELQKSMDSLRQSRDQFQLDLTRSSSSVESQKKELLDWERKKFEWEQKIQELKFNMSQVETKAHESILRLQDENRQLQQDYDSLEKNQYLNRESWANKTEERNLIEKNLRESLITRETEVASLRKELSLLEPRTRSQFEAEKASALREYQEILSRKEIEIAGMKGELLSLESRLRAQHEKDRSALLSETQDKISRKDKEIADMKVDLKETEGRIQQRIEKEKSTILDRADKHFREEISLKAEITQRELTLIRESVINDLMELDEQIKQQRTEQQSAMTKKETELMDAVHAMKDLQKELLEERSRSQLETGVIHEKFEQVLKEAELKAAETLKNEEEKQRQTSDISTHIAQERDQTLQEFMAVKRELEEKNEILRVLKKEFGIQDIPTEKLPAALENQSFIRKFWRYLNRTVLVLTLRTNSKDK